MTTRRKLLIVDDETDLLAELKPLLERSGFEVVTAIDGEQALQRVEEAAPDLIVLDVLMPHLDGREVLRRLRSSNNWTPVILLTQVGTSMERAMSLQEGADDYLNKPYDPLELIARIQAILRRVQHGSQALTSYRRLISGDLVLDRQARQARLGSRTLSLTARAFGVLEYMMLHAGEAVARERLLDEVWGWAYPVDTRAVDIRIAEIRKAVDDDASEPKYIETVVGYGYRFIASVEGQP
jgi:DNA-binding response OmpR family regulator